MKRKSTRKLALHRESLRDLDPENLKRAAGGTWSGSENCTQTCHAVPRSGQATYCICAECQTNTCLGVCA